jgi:peptide deformylase
MAVREILQIGNPILRQRSSKITRFGDGLAKLVEDMLETMHDANGVGLAAPQIGVSKRLIVVEMPESDDYPHPGERFILCNPEIVKASRETVVGQEGCLSVAGYVGMVERAEEVIVRGQDLKGRRTRVKGDGYLARALQHEIDHLNGVLYVEIAEEDSVMTLEEYQQQIQEQQAAAEGDQEATEDASMPI